jgi:nitrile hydratase
MSGNHSHNSEHHGEHHPEPQAYAALRTKAIESLLIEKGLLSTDAIDARVQAYEQDIGPLNGAKVVARAWTDAEYKKRLLEDGTAAVAELGFFGAQGAEIIALENTSTVHNVVVCTLCSCYPWPVLGLPPRWYKSDAYRARVVIEPRAVLQEFGLALDESVEVRVWDSNSDIRYMVLPERPEGTDGMGEDALAGLVTRDSMIGVAQAKTPMATA